MADHDAHGHDHLAHLPSDATPAVFAAQAGVAFASPAGAEELELIVARFFAALSGALADAGCTLVGHIKGTLAVPGHGDLAFHATALATPPALTGGIAGLADDALLTINVIVFGVGEEGLRDVVVGAWAEATSAVTVWRP
jgi:hypothetical protein